MRTLIAIPCGDYINYQFIESLMALRPVGETSVQFRAGSLVYDARNQLVQMAVEKQYDYIFWLDSDMVFEPDLLERMFEALSENELVSGLYATRRSRPFRPTVFDSVGYEKDPNDEKLVTPTFKYHMDYSDLNQFEIAACGFGCVLMQTSLAKDILEKAGLPFTPIPGFGEDIAFCMRATQLGHKLYCDPKITVGHVGTQVVDGTEVYRYNGLVNGDDQFLH